MKRIILSVFALCFLSALSFAQGFEGVITMSMSIPQMGDKPMPMVMSMKGEKSLTHMEMGPMGATDIYKDGSTKMVMVMKAMNMGYEMDLAKVKEQASKDEKIPEITATGKKEKINGYNCEKYVCTLEKGMTMEMWMTSELPKNISTAIANSIQGGMRSAASSGTATAFEEMMKKGLATIRVSVKKDGEEQAQINFEKFEAKSLPDELFIVPAGVNIMQMPSGMGGGMGR